MTILALEFSSDRRSVALARDGVVLAEAAQQTESRATDALGLIEKVLREAHVPRGEIQALAVGLGPGSYTGIRAAIAVAQGWELATGAKLLGVSSVSAMAEQAQREHFFGRVQVAVDAQRGEFYLSSWEIAVERRTEVVPLRIVAAAEVERLRAAGETILGGNFFPTAAAVARLAAGRLDFVAGAALQPVYLRETTFVKAPLPLR